MTASITNTTTTATLSVNGSQSGNFQAGTAYCVSQTLTDGATVNWNGALGQVATLTLGGNRTMAAPVNLVPNAFYSIEVIQDGTGSRTLVWNSAFKWASGSAPSLTSAAGSRDYFSFRSDGTNLYEQGRTLGVA